MMKEQSISNQLITNNVPRVLNEKELARYLGISYWTLRKLRMNSKLPYFRTEKRIFYCVEDVMKWIHTQGEKNMDSQKCAEYSLD